MNNDINYLFEIEDKKIEILNLYYEILKKILKLNIKDDNFDEILMHYFEEISAIFQDLKEYNTIFLTLIKDNRNFIDNLKIQIKKEEEMKQSINSLIDDIIQKYTKEGNEIQKIISKLKIQLNNPLSENNPRFFETKI